MSTTTTPVRYRIPEYVAFVHAEEISEYASVTTYLAGHTNRAGFGVGGVSIHYWGIFEEPFSLPEALELIAELTEQNPEDIRGRLRGLSHPTRRRRAAGSCLTRPAPLYRRALRVKIFTLKALCLRRIV